MTIIAPSLLGADLLHLEREVRLVERLELPWLHFDNMDGHFVPNISFGPDFVAAVRKKTSLYLDVHLMLERPGDYIECYVRAGADGITVHAETENPEETLCAIRKAGKKSGLALNPGTPASTVVPFLPLVDMVLVMTVQPGFGGQSLRKECLDKVKMIRKMADRVGKLLLIEADGGIHEDNAEEVIEAGVDVLVMGTGLFRANDPARVVRHVLESHTKGC